MYTKQKTLRKSKCITLLRCKIKSIQKTRIPEKKTIPERAYIFNSNSNYCQHFIEQEIVH